MKIPAISFLQINPTNHTVQINVQVKHMKTQLQETVNPALWDVIPVLDLQPAPLAVQATSECQVAVIVSVKLATIQTPTVAQPVFFAPLKWQTVQHVLKEHFLA